LVRVTWAAPLVVRRRVLLWGMEAAVVQESLADWVRAQLAAAKLAVVWGGLAATGSAHQLAGVVVVAAVAEEVVVMGTAEVATAMAVTAVAVKVQALAAVETAVAVATATAAAETAVPESVEEGAGR